MYWPAFKTVRLTIYMVQIDTDSLNLKKRNSIEATYIYTRQFTKAMFVE